MPARSVVAVALGALFLTAAPGDPARASPSPPPPRLLFSYADASIDESSGLAVSSVDPSRVLTHVDSGGPAAYFVVDARGRTVARVPVPGATNVDWEDIAVSGHTVYLADIGDNRATRPSVTVYAVPEYAGPKRAGPERAGAGSPARASVARLTYDDGPHDAEALLVPPGRAPAFVVTKGLFGAGVYRIDRARLRHVADLHQGLVTGGSWSPDGTRIALVSYVGIDVYAAATWPSGDPVAIDLPPLRQAESIAWRGNDTLLVGSEGVHSPVYAVSVPPPAGSPTATPGAIATPGVTTGGATAGGATAGGATAGGATATPGATAPGAAVDGPHPARAPSRGRGWQAAAGAVAALAVGLVVVAARVRRRRDGGVG